MLIFKVRPHATATQYAGKREKRRERGRDRERARERIMQEGNGRFQGSPFSIRCLSRSPSRLFSLHTHSQTRSHTHTPTHARTLMLHCQTLQRTLSLSPSLSFLSFLPSLSPSLPLCRNADACSLARRCARLIRSLAFFGKWKGGNQLDPPHTRPTRSPPPPLPLPSALMWLIWCDGESGGRNIPTFNYRQKRWCGISIKKVCSFSLF